MKKYSFTILLLIVVSWNLTMCGEEENDEIPTELQAQIAALKNGGADWKVLSVVKDGYDVTGQFDGFTLSIEDNIYNTTNGLESAWPASGTWEFQDNDPNLILRDGITLISLQLTDNELTLSFSSSGILGGRVSGIDGEYLFIMTSE